MRRAWSGASIELVDFSRQPAPEGAIQFPRSGLHAGPAAFSQGSLWLGWVEYGVNRRFSIWARARVTVRVEEVVAVNDLRSGRAIAAGEVQLAAREEVPGSVSLSPAATALEQAVGKWLRQPVRRGDTIRLAWLAEPKVVLRGDNVKVTVHNGGAQLELDGLAENSGAVGETVTVRNPDSQRRFRARVEERGRVTVDATGGKR